MATVHLCTAGTDAGNVVALGTVVVVSAVIATLTVVRILTATRRSAPSTRIPASARDARATVRSGDAPAPIGPLPATGDLLPTVAGTVTAGGRAGATATLTRVQPVQLLHRPTVEERAARIRRASRAASARVADGPPA